MDCADGRWVEMAPDRVQWHMAPEELSFRVLLAESSAVPAVKRDVLCGSAFYNLSGN